MSEPITLEQLKNASLDAQSLDVFVNGDENTDVTTRTNQTYPTLAKLGKRMMENGLIGATPYDTLAKMQSAPAEDGAYAVVTNDNDPANNGLYIKKGTWILTSFSSSSPKSGLAQLAEDLTNPLVDVNIALVGDSITWGVGASNTTARTPYNKRHDDARNTTDPASPSWANLLRQWLVHTYTGSPLTHEAAGVASGIVSQMVVISANLAHITLLDTRTHTKLSTDHAKTRFNIRNVKSNETLDLLNVNNTFAGTAPTALEFTASGESVDIIYSKLAFGTAGSYYATVYVDGVEQGRIGLFGASSFDNVYKIPLPNNGKHTIKIINNGTQNSPARIQHIEKVKTVRVANHGISGSSTYNWLSSGSAPLSGVLSRKDDYVFMQLGTNNRIKTSFHNQGRFAQELDQLVKDVETLTQGNAQTILMCANDVTQDQDPSTSSYYMTMRMVHEIVKTCADKNNLSFISNYDATTQARLDNISYLADSLHPNDTGYRIMFDNIKDHIRGVK